MPIEEMRLLPYLSRIPHPPEEIYLRFRSLLFFAALTATLGPSLAFAQEPSERPAPAQQDSARAGMLKLLPADSVTEHVLTAADGRKIAYTATAGTLDLFGQDGGQNAAIFYTAYVAKDAGPNRPITFAFNGGPGAASAFLHLGLVGPKVLDFGPDGRDGANAKLVDNTHSWLDFTDLVLIDPIGTGWSRTVKADDASNYYKVGTDAQTMAKTIALYIAHNNRAT
jgi:carboxypeptidase C (cathepsin A)